MTDLPRGWASGPLSDFVTPRGERVSPGDFPELPFIGMDHVEARTTRIVGSVPSRQMKSNALRFYGGDVLYGRLRPYLNKVAQPRFDGLASAEFVVFEGAELIEAGFLRYRLLAQDFVSFATHLNEGDRPRVSFEQIGDFEILVAPLNEQSRIVAMIETLFDEIDRGIESLRIAKELIGLYRHSLLKSAFEGRLTADWRADHSDKLECPEVLLVRIRGERERRYWDALEEWQRAVAEWKNGSVLGRKPRRPKPPVEFDLLRTSECLSWPSVSVRALLGAPLVNGRSAKDRKGGFPVLRLTALQSGKIDLRESKEGDWSEEDAEPFLVKRGDIFVSRGNGSKRLVGIAGLVLHEPMPVAFPDTMIRLRPDISAVRPEYFVLVWNSWTVRQQIEESARTTAGIYKINQRHVCGFVLPLPSLAEQSEIVRIVHGRLAAARSLEREIDANLDRADALRQSILSKAFSGHLVPQDPTDELASSFWPGSEPNVTSERPKLSRRRTEA